MGRFWLEVCRDFTAQTPRDQVGTDARQPSVRSPQFASRARTELLVARSFAGSARLGCLCTTEHQTRSEAMNKFDWHSDQIKSTTPITPSYRNTQNARRFFKSRCGAGFKFDRSFMAWLKDGAPKTMGEAVMEWKRRQRTSKL